MKEIRLSEWIGEGFYDIHRDIRGKRQRESRVHRNSEHRIVAPTIRIHSFAACGPLRGSTPEYPTKEWR